MQKILLLLSVFVLSAQMSIAQPWLKYLPQHKKQTELTLYDYKKAFDTYWEPFQVNNQGYYYKNGIKKKASGWKQFHRWYYNMESQVDPSTGAFPKKTAQQVYNEFYQAHPEYKRSSKTANWTSLGPNSSDGGYAGIGRVNCVAFHPTDNNTYWVGAPSGGLWRTTDNGNTWTCLTNNTGLEALGVSDIVVLPNYDQSQTIYIATGDRDAWSSNGIGVLKTTDGGATWQTTDLSFPLSWFDKVNRLLLDPNNNNTLIAVTSWFVYKTTDGGATWSPKFQAPQNVQFIDMEYKPDDFNVLYLATKSGQICTSSDAGENWSALQEIDSNGGGARVELAVTPDNSNYVYALVAKNNNDRGLLGVYRSTNQGVTFTKMVDGDDKPLLNWSETATGDNEGQSFYDLSLAVSPTNADVVWVGGISTWKSIDGGTNWQISNFWRQSGTTQTVHADKHSLKYRSNGDLFEANDGGLYLLSNGDVNWVDKTNGMVISQMYKLGVSATNIDEVITGLQDNGTKLLSNNTWDDVKSGDGMECLIDYTDANIQYGSYVYGQISRTDNHWVSSTNIQPKDANGQPVFGAWVTPYIIDPVNHETLYAGYANVWKTTDKGSTWTQLSTTINSAFKLRSMAIAPSDNNTMYVADLAKIWKTTDGGTTWTNIKRNLPTDEDEYINHCHITSIAVKDDDPNCVWVTLSAYNEHVVYETSDGGATNWINISKGLPDIPAYSIVQNKQVTGETHLYVGTELGVYFKKGVANWVEYNNTLPKVRVGELEIYYDEQNHDNSKLFMASYGRGLWSSPLEQFELPQLIISEVTHPANSANAKFVEIYNPTNQNINLTNVYLQKQTNGGSGTSSLSGFFLSGDVAANSSYVCAKVAQTFLDAYGFDANVTSGVIDGNGNDAYILRYAGENGTIIDIYGVWNEDGTGKPWDYKKSQAVRKRNVTQGSSSWQADEWVIVKNANKVQMTPGEHKEDKIWEGNTNIDWDTKNNWTAINTRHFLPDASSNVFIPETAANQPILSNHAIVNDLTVNDKTAVLTVNPTNSIKVLGVLITSQGSNLLLKADVNGSAVLLHNTNNVYGSMEVYYPNLDKWYYIGSPISDAVSGLYLGEYLYSWDETQGTWQNIVPEDVPLVPATGYAVEKKANNIVTYEGSFNNGNITSPDITYSNASSDSDKNGWNLLSNPYPSVIDIEQLTFPADVTAGVSVFRHGDYGYTVYSQGGGGDEEARYIQPGQAFMVKSSAATAQQLLFTNALRTSAQIGVLDKSKADSAQKKETLCLSLYSEEVLKDKTYISFREGSTVAYDNYYDMYKIQGATTHLFSYLGQSADSPQLAINSIPHPQVETQIPLGVTIEPGNYILTASQLDEFESTQAFYVFDKQMNKYIDLRTQPKYVFVVTEDDDPHRFDLYFYKPEQVEDMQTAQDLFYLAQDKNALYIKSYTDTYEDLFVEVVNVLGQKVYQNTRYQLSQPIVLPKGQQIYVVTIHANQDKYVYKVIMK